MNKFFLPRLKKLCIYDYSLYKCPIKIDFSPKLNIIYGTNGTGKSTLLMLILFSIVGSYRGGVKTKTYKEERKDNRPLYGDSFFSDRVGYHSEVARIESEFIINNDRYVVVHSLNNNNLLSVSINDIRLKGEVVNYKTYEKNYFDNENKNDIKRYLIYNYHEQLKKSTKLPGGINTLISMLLDVMFFNEGRKFIFWNLNLQETVIGKYIVDAQFYEDYCEKKLATKALESKYKKISETWNYMSKFLKKEQKEDSQVYGDKNELGMQLELGRLDSVISTLEQHRCDDQKLYEKKNMELMSFSKKEELLKEELASLENIWYSNLFPSQYDIYYKKFSKQLSENICPVCGNAHKFFLKTECCIMCGEKISLKKQPDLLKIDIKRKDKHNELSKIKSEISEIIEELNEIKQRIDKTKKEINEQYYKKNRIEIYLNPDKNPFAENDARRLEKANEERNKALLEFNTSKTQENEMRKIIEESLVDKFKQFRDAFLKYANSFFGSEHQLNLYLPFRSDGNKESEFSINNDELMIRFSLDDKERIEDYMLSESQRIFTDLAFRMAILTTFHDTSFFICETPDSTLDIFHENNAVKTFENFIKKGNSLFLTANARKGSLISTLYKTYEKKDVNIIDLTQMSNLALDKHCDFQSYIKGAENGL